MTGVEQFGLVSVFGCGNRPVELLVDVLRQLVGQRVERIRENLHRIHRIEFLADRIEFLVDLGDGLHVDIELHAHFLAEDVDQFDRRSRRSAGEVPDIRIDDVDAGLDRSHDGSQPVTGRTVRMEVDRNRQVFFEQLDQIRNAFGRDQSAHVLDRDHIGAQSGHLLRLVQEILVGENRFRKFLPFQRGLDTFHRREMRVDRVAHGAVGDTAVLLDILDRRLHVVHVVQRVENTHDAQSRLDRIAAESLDDLIGIRSVSEQVASAGQRGQFRNVAHDGLDLFEAVPRVFVQVAHYGVGHGAAPHLHGVKISVFIERQDAVDLLLLHPGGKSGLLSVPEGQIPYQKFLSHSCFD